MQFGLRTRPKRPALTFLSRLMSRDTPVTSQTSVNIHEHKLERPKKKPNITSKDKERLKQATKVFLPEL